MSGDWYVALDKSNATADIYLNGVTFSKGISSSLEEYNIKLHLSGDNRIEGVASSSELSGIGITDTRSPLTIDGSGTLTIDISGDLPGKAYHGIGCFRVLTIDYDGTISIIGDITGSNSNFLAIANGYGINITRLQGLNISASATYDVYGITAQEAITMNCPGTVNINAGNEARGIMHYMGGTINLNAPWEFNMAATSGQAFGIRAYNDLNCNDLTVSASGLAAYAIVSSYGKVSTNGNCDITVSGGAVGGIETGNGVLLGGSKKHVNISGFADGEGKSFGISTFSGDVTINNSCTINLATTNETNGFLMHDDSSINGSGNVDITLSSTSPSYGIKGEKSLTIGGSGTTTINSSGSGIGATNNVNISDNPTLNITDYRSGIESESGNINISGGSINIVDNRVLSPACALHASQDVNISGGVLNLYSKGAHDVNMGGNFNMSGGYLRAETEATLENVYAIGKNSNKVSIEKINITTQPVKIGATLADAEAAEAIAATDEAITTSMAIIIGTVPAPAPRRSGGGGSAPSYGITENGGAPTTTGGAPATTGGNSSGDNTTVNKGDVTVSTKNATAGQKVTVTVNEGIGYVLDDLTIKTADGKEVKAVDNGDGTFTFEMPAGTVDIEPTFTPDPKVLEKYQDVNPEQYYYQPIAWADKKGITNGVDAKNFGVNSECTRAQMVTFLWRMAGCPVVNNAAGFTDVKADSYYEQAVAWATSMGYVKGYSATQFAPDQIVNRCQTVAIMARMAGVADDATGYTHGFADVNSSAYYNNAVAWASQNGITSGRSNTLFAPNDDCFRQELITFLFRFDK